VPSTCSKLLDGLNSVLFFLFSTLPPLVLLPAPAPAPAPAPPAPLLLAGDARMEEEGEEEVEVVEGAVGVELPSLESSGTGWSSELIFFFLQIKIFFPKKAIWPF